MKLSEIEELRNWQTGAELDSEAESQIKRLLQEREMLLEVASNVRVSLLMCIENPDDPLTSATMMEYARLLGDAIRKAES